MFGFSKELVPPSGVEHSVYTNFTGRDHKNLVVAKHNLLEIYLLDEGAIDAGDPRRKPLRLLSQQTLYGTIESLSVSKFPKACDFLILSFRDAKATILEWDPAAYTTKIVSMHYYEEVKAKVESGREDYFCPPIAHVDPEDRCMAMLCFDRFFGVVPFNRNYGDNLLLGRGNEDAKVLPSYVIDLISVEINPPIDHVKDFVFLEGYYQPTLLILYEPEQTWAGRAAQSKNTCAVTAISLDLIHQENPVIWTVDHLPYDCFQLLPIPKPVGGALVLSVNTVIVCNQNVKYQLALNNFVPDIRSSSFSTDRLDEPLSLDAARFAFLSPTKLIASLKGGELWIFNIVAEAGAVRRITASSSSASVISSCICPIDDKYFFLGSRVGNSLLIGYREVSVVQPDSAPEKRAKRDGEEESELDSDIANFYSSARPVSAKKQTEYNFRLVDTLINIGPIGDFCFGTCSDRPREHFSNTEKALPFDPEEIVACSGYGKNGALTVLQRGIRHTTSLALPLPCHKIWTLFEAADAPETLTGKRKRETLQQTEAKKDHGLIVMSTESSSMVLTARNELKEITEHKNLAFQVDSPTLDAGNLLDNRYIVQVSKKEVRMLQSWRSLHSNWSATDEIVESVICDPFVVLSFGPGKPLAILYADHETEKLKKEDLLLSGSDGEILSFCLYRDSGSGILCPDRVKSKASTGQPNLSGQAESSSTTDAMEHESDKQDEDDEFALLYGDSEPKAAPAQSSSSAVQAPEDEDSDFENLYGESKPVVAKEKVVVDDAPPASPPVQDAPANSSKFYIMITRDSGYLEIYALNRQEDRIIPELYFTCSRFARGVPLLTDDQSMSLSDSTRARAAAQQTQRTIVEMRLQLIGIDPMPYLFALNNLGDLYIYGSFHFEKELRFYRYHHQLITRPIFQIMTATEQRDDDNKLEENHQPRSDKRLFVFKHGNREGIFIAGMHPHWVFADRGLLRLFPMTSEHFVDCYADFHNTEFCQNGFIYSVKNAVSISWISNNSSSPVNYENAWVLRKITLRQNNKLYSPRKICYHKQTNSYIVSVASMEIVSKHDKERGGLTHAEEKHEILLVSLTSNGARILNAYPFDQYEHVLALCPVELLYKGSGTKSEMRSMISVGTAFIEGEDEASKGRVFVFDIITKREDDNSISLKIKHLIDNTEKGPVSAVNSIMGHLIIAIGRKILIYNYENEKELIGKAFFDTQIFVVSLKTIKNYILVADMFSSVYFLIWKRLIKQLTLLAKDYGRLQLTEAEFLVDNEKLGLFITDRSLNAQIMSFDPNNINSRARGKMLIPACEYHLGDMVMKSQRTRIYPHGDGIRFGSVYATTSGAIGIVSLIDEEAYNCLLTLQSKMLYGIAHPAGLNPKAYRKYKPHERQLRPRNNVLLDIDHLLRYNSLGLGFQKEFANLIKSRPEEIFQFLSLASLAGSLC